MGKGKNMQTQDNIETCYRRETEVLGEKSICDPLSQNDPLVNKFGVQGYQKKKKKTLQA